MSLSRLVIVSAKMQIQGLRWATIAAVQKRRRGGVVGF
jgi:hypothetical protein